MAGILLLTACTPNHVKQLLEHPPSDLPKRVVLNETPFFPSDDTLCGPTSLASIFGYFGSDATVSSLARAVYVPDLEGSLQAEMVAATRRNGLIAYPLPSNLTSLLREIAAQHPVLVLQNLGLKSLPKWHYAVAVGFDLEKGEIILHSGERAFLPTSLKTFAYTWARSGNWGLVPLPPGRLPMDNDGKSYFVAAGEFLQHSENVQQSETVYREALNRWPDESVLSLGLANYYYQSGEYAAATSALMFALDYQPNDATLYNNLAYSLVAQRCAAAAKKAIACAVKSEPLPAYRESAKEITELLSEVRGNGADNVLCPTINCPAEESNKSEPFQE